MIRGTVSPEIVSSSDDNAAGVLGFRSIRDRFKRSSTDRGVSDRKTTSLPDRQWRRSQNRSMLRKCLLFPLKCRSLLYCCVLFAVFAFAMASMVLQTSIMSVFRQGNERGKAVRTGLKFGSSLEFVPWRTEKRIELGGGIEWLRKQPRVVVRPPKLAIILGHMKIDSSTLMLFTVLKNLQGLGYTLKIYATEDGEARFIWDKIGVQVLLLDPQNHGRIDWTRFEGIIVDSLEANISSLMQEPFCSVPLIWIIQDAALANRLSVYEDMGWDHLISYWKNTFSRADVVVFPDFSLPMLYSVLDTGNFFVIPGSPIDVWAAESYSRTHSRSQLRQDKGYSKEDMLVLIVGSSFFYKELSWDYDVSMHNIGPLLSKYARLEDNGAQFKFVFLCGNSSDGYNDALQVIASHMGLRPGSVRHYGLDDDVNGLLLMVDIVIYGSSQDEQGFPPLLIRAMSFGIPVVAPDYPVIKKYLIDGVHAMIFSKHKPDAIMTSFSLLISKGELSKYAHAIASSGRLVARNMLASECTIKFAKLLENVLAFPSDARLPDQVSELKQGTWEWDMFQKEIEVSAGDRINLDLKTSYTTNSGVLFNLEEEMTNLFPAKNFSGNETDIMGDDVLSQLDWDILTEMESSEEVQRLESEELEERLEKEYGVWDELYRNVRKAEKISFKTNERDEGELERTGQPVCIYEIYDGAGAWPSLHHGSLYRGLSLSTRARRSRSDDVDAVRRLPLLNDTFYRDILCEIGGMFAIANSVDNIHKRPWIGYQSWRASGRKVALTSNAEKALENTIQENPKGDVIYFWARMDIDDGLIGSNAMLTFWSMCDVFNGGNCRTAFDDAFRRMYGLPKHVEALPPMPEDGGHWSALHSWVMPTPSFVEFVMFSRMFADSLDISNKISSKTSQCFLGVSVVEKRHCYCRVLEILVNVWAYHSGRKMVYINPETGLLEEQHPVEQRKPFMWAKYFDITLLKRMDEDLAEAADDGDHPSKMWLWPLTGEVYWQGVYEREREERYRLKMDKKRKTKEKLLERMKYGYKQKSLGG
ncbi:uncharacterized protein LOC141707188 isoform X1 [Apium graveolens]|uniref:uncharacterized protein LOC141707188 isoform X1 n=2 Tax=Apium graveolens TaxID=4045 RepID=UPI003D79D5C2